MGAEISMNANKMADVKTRKDCTEEKYLDLVHPIRGQDPFNKNNDKVATRYYKTQLREICSKGYYKTYRDYGFAAFHGNIINPVGNHEHF
jgi:hypothetical protein